MRGYCEDRLGKRFVNPVSFVEFCLFELGYDYFPLVLVS